MSRPAKDEQTVLKEMFKNILSGKTKEYCVVVKTLKENEYSIATEGARTMVGRIYRNWDGS